MYLLWLFLFFSASNLRRGRETGLSREKDTQPTATTKPKEQDIFWVLLGQVVFLTTVTTKDLPHKGRIPREQFCSLTSIVTLISEG